MRGVPGERLAWRESSRGSQGRIWSEVISREEVEEGGGQSKDFTGSDRHGWH